MEVKISRAGVTGVADITNNFALTQKLSGYQSVGVALQMGVIKHELFIGAELIDCCATAFALEEFYDLAIGSGHHRRSRRRRNIYRIMHPSRGARVSEGVQQLIRPDSHDGNDQLQGADVIPTRQSRRGCRRFHVCGRR